MSSVFNINKLELENKRLRKENAILTELAGLYKDKISELSKGKTDKPITNKKLAEIKQLVESWLEKQGHEKCWYYPEIFAKIAEVSGAVLSTYEELPPRNDFENGCKKYQDDLYKEDLLQKQYDR